MSEKSRTDSTNESNPLSLNSPQGLGGAISRLAIVSLLAGCCPAKTGQINEPFSVYPCRDGYKFDREDSALCIPEEFGSMEEMSESCRKRGGELLIATSLPAYAVCQKGTKVLR